uniref:ATP synthase CF0 subunit IV n=1 Tax=Prototheca lentecrescens TaxID=2836214 RepID=UPI00300234E9
MILFIHYIMFYSFILTDLSIGQHWYWFFGPFKFHGEVLVSSWVVFYFLILFAIVCTLKRAKLPGILQCCIEVITDFIVNIAKTQIGENNEYHKWISFLGTLFIFIFASNWLGELLPWWFYTLPNGELAAPTNDINTTTALALLTSCAYFFAGIKKKGLSYFKRYITPAPFLLPINLLEDITKPLSLSFRLFGNILADELIIGVLLSLFPFVIPVPMIILSLFTSGIQALVFTTLTGAYIGEALEEHY